MQNPEDSDSSSDGDYYGPALPPNLQNKSSPAPDVRNAGIGSGTVTSGVNKSISIGPTLPPGFKIPTEENGQDSEIPAPEVPSPEEYSGSEASDSDDSEIIGPLPPDHPKALKRAACSSSSKSDHPSKPPKKLQREEWMLIPPTNKSVTELGLGPRKFLQRAPAEPVKDSDEEVDSDEEFEKQTRAEMDQKIIDEYDKTMEAMIEKSGAAKNRSETLLEIHQKELKKAKANVKSEPKTERKPFDRNTDLAVGGLSREDAKKYVEKTRELSGRFHKGRQKFL